mmetsp:Transcript_13631/g.19994  ORF Transcript_13631/g.19994 Transcript_13631/m.19994 type:complete len:117 (-) Transcript_13631:682-1032(-)
MMGAMGCQIAIATAILLCMGVTYAFQSSRLLPTPFRQCIEKRHAHLSVFDDITELQTVVGNEGAVGETADLPPVLQGIMDERREFNMNLGRAMDVLRKDYPYMLYKSPGKFVLHSC